MKSRLEAVDNWITIECDQSLHKLIKAIQKICVGHDDTNQDMCNVVQACKNIFLFKQDDGVSTEDYIRDFKHYWDTNEAYKVAPAFHPLLIKEKLVGVEATPGARRQRLAHQRSKSLPKPSWP